MAEDRNRARQISLETRFDDMSQGDTGVRLNDALRKVYDGVNEARFVEKLPAPRNVTATSRTGGVLMTWDAISREYIESLYGARIWRVNEADDPKTQFSENGKRRILVPIVLTTAYFDPTSDTDTYIYWVQWVDLLERVSEAQGGASAAGS